MMLQSSPARGLFSTLVVLGLLVLETVAVVTTGATNGGVASRREIRDLINDKTSWYLYIQALAAIQAVDQDHYSSLSWYQMAGTFARGAEFTPAREAHII